MAAKKRKAVVIPGPVHREWRAPLTEEQIEEHGTTLAIRVTAQDLRDLAKVVGRLAAETPFGRVTKTTAIQWLIREAAKK